MHSAYYSNSRNPILQSSFEQIHFPSILVSETLLRSRQCKFYFKNSILQVHQFQWQFIHSFYNAGASIGKSSTSTSKNIQLVIHHSYALTWTRDSMQNQGHSSRTRILRGRSNKLLENKFLVYIDLFKIHSFGLQI